jgi:hypothetical protein
MILFGGGDRGVGLGGGGGGVEGPTPQAAAATFFDEDAYLSSIKDQALAQVMIDCVPSRGWVNCPVD